MAGSTIELVSEDQVLNALKSGGPVVPMDVRQILKRGDSIIIGATLSTLAARGVVKITSIKRGGSPFYYLPGQEEKLAELSKYLGEKDRRTFELLRQKQVLRDKEEEPLVRVSLRNLPDFAKRIDIDVGGQQEIVWRWYMISDEEAIGVLTKKSEKKEITEEKKEEKEAVPEVKEEDEKKTEKAPRKKREKKSSEPFGTISQEAQQQLLEQPVQPVQSSIANFNDAFINRAAGFLSSVNIMIKDSKQVKKGAEYDLLIEIPTPVGSIDYFCKVKGKKKCSEADLSSAYVQGQGLRLPVLFLTTGEVVKKAKDKLKTDFKGMIVKEL